MGRLRVLIASALSLALTASGQGCGLASHDAPIPDAPGVGGATGGQGISTGGTGRQISGGLLGWRGGSTGAEAGAGAPAAVDLDASDCAQRPLSDCDGVQSRYESNVGFLGTPAFAQCEPFNSFDHCGHLQFAFNAEGCAISVAPGGERVLSELGDCLRDALKLARFPCLASGQLRYEESCFVR